MKKEYIVFTKYGDVFDSYLWIVKENKKLFHEKTFQKQQATLFTLKQAQKICFNKNQELKKTFSFCRVWGYETL